MACDECKKLQEEEGHAWESLQQQRTMNRQMGFHGKQANQVEQGLEHAYNLARASSRLHKGSLHQDEGHKAGIDDLNTIIRKGRTRP